MPAGPGSPVVIVGDVPGDVATCPSCQRKAAAVRLLPHPLRLATGVAFVAIVFYAVPVQNDRSVVVRTLISLAALGILAMVITRHVRRRDDPVGRLLLLLVVAMATLALVFYGVATVPGEFEGLRTRTDALYFTVMTMLTIGYGDIHPVGQLARVLVVTTVVFYAVYVATLVSVIAHRLRDQEKGVAGER